MRDLLVKVPAPARFSFRHEAAGTRVLDCFLPYRRFDGVVDVEARAVELREVDGPPIAYVRPGEVLLAAEAIGADGMDVEWVRLDDVDQSAREVLRRVVGAELAGYLVEAPPPSGRDTVLAALDEGAEVAIVRRDASGIRVQLTVAADPRDVAVVADVSPEGWVEQVTVTPAGADGAEVGASGWTVRYAPTHEEAQVPRVDAEEVQLGALLAYPRPNARSCDVPQ